MPDKPHVLIYLPWYEAAMRRLDELAVTHHMYRADDKVAFLKEFRSAMQHHRNDAAMPGQCDRGRA